MAQNKKEKLVASRTVKKNKWIFNESDYEFDSGFKKANSVSDIHTTIELVEALKNNKDVDIDARVIAFKEGKFGIVKLGKKEFLEHWGTKKKISAIKRAMKESYDPFLFDGSDGMGSNRLGDDFTPLLGGPFYKQLYIQDYLRMHAAAFWASNHDPMAKCYMNMIVDFTLGRGFRIDIPDDPSALALWRAFEDVNNFEKFMQGYAYELALYGENLVWFLPNQQTKIVYKPTPGETIPRALLPRIRSLDPSNIWEIITYPEDITRVLAYQWIAPTQYQTYSSTDKENVTSSKFIFQQIPADQIIHEKVNCVSNEKRGRSDLFPVLGYLKRLRDTINYQIAAAQKNAAWAIDTTIQGSQTDIDAYISAQEEMGTYAPAGSEFVHTDKITRTYQAASTGGGKTSGGQTFEWTLSMIASGLGFPISYFGTHLSGGQTRGSAIVATEPVAKKLQNRQLVYERVIKQVAKKFFDQIGYSKPVEIEVTFPEIIVENRSDKLKDLAIAEGQGWISKKRAAAIAAKELGITEYDFEEEMKDVEAGQENPAQSLSPLSSPASLPTPKAGGLSSEYKSNVRKNDLKV